MSFRAKIRTSGGSGARSLAKRTKKGKGIVKVGIIDPKNRTDDSDLNTAEIGFVHEFGAEIDHPGGTPYVIGANGQANFVSLDRGGAVAGFTKPHKIIIPERSFIRSTLSEERKEIAALTKRLYRAILRGKMDSKKALGLLGIDMADRISQKIVKIKSPANKPGTIKRKRSSNPLVDTGQLKNSITWEVVP